MGNQTTVDDPKLPAMVADAFNELNFELSKVIGLSSSVRIIGQALPVTSLENDDAICPEIVFPALALGLLQHGNKSMSLIERLQGLLRDQGFPIKE
jgi:hypothetical protein